MGKHHNKMNSNYVRLCLAEAAQTPATNAGMIAKDDYNEFLYRLPVQRPRFYRPQQHRENALASTLPRESRGLDWMINDTNMQALYDPTA